MTSEKSLPSKGARNASAKSRIQKSVRETSIDRLFDSVVLRCLRSGAGLATKLTSDIFHHVAFSMEEGASASL